MYLLLLRFEIVPARLTAFFARSGGVVSVGSCEGGRMTLLCRPEPVAHVIEVREHATIGIQMDSEKCISEEKGSEDSGVEE